MDAGSKIKISVLDCLEKRERAIASCYVASTMKLLRSRRQSASSSRMDVLKLRPRQRMKRLDSGLPGCGQPLILVVPPPVNSFA